LYAFELLRSYDFLRTTIQVLKKVLERVNMTQSQSHGHCYKQTTHVIIEKTVIADPMVCNGIEFDIRPLKYIQYAA
jgi:hypothetical protein